MFIHSKLALWVFFFLDIHKRMGYIKIKLILSIPLSLLQAGLRRPVFFLSRYGDFMDQDLRRLSSAIESLSREIREFRKEFFGNSEDHVFKSEDSLDPIARLEDIL